MTHTVPSVEAEGTSDRLAATAGGVGARMGG